ncbi:Solute carrier family 22 member 7 [Chionoecetes opilio]|uniref:Solute carrier family 22 member 7 n=1 Tax=Chionoecetes opilio TaxID=41210 RepID=A0A8J4YWF4_CHIOP|nr:Solute carrier family 22 member 7 [Chionoecetes opilio]
MEEEEEEEEEKETHEMTTTEEAATQEERQDSAHIMSTFEDLLELAGTLGPWNILMFCMCSVSAFNSAFPMYSYQFLGATPDHWCSVGPLLEANWTQHQVLSFAIPLSNSIGKHESCLMYDYNYSTVVEMGYDAAMENRSLFGAHGGLNNTIKCYSRDFNLTQYQSTVVTEWDLVCERRVLYSSTQSVVMGGRMVGYILFGYLIDV